MEYVAKEQKKKAQKIAESLGFKLKEKRDGEQLDSSQEEKWEQVNEILQQ
jgi:hypothetical protein